MSRSTGKSRVGRQGSRELLEREAKSRSRGRQNANFESVNGEAKNRSRGKTRVPGEGGKTQTSSQSTGKPRVGREGKQESLERENKSPSRGKPRVTQKQSQESLESEAMSCSRGWQNTSFQSVDREAKSHSWKFSFEQTRMLCTISIGHGANANEANASEFSCCQLPGRHCTSRPPRKRLRREPGQPV